MSLELSNTFTTANTFIGLDSSRIIYNGDHWKLCNDYSKIPYEDPAKTADRVIFSPPATIVLWKDKTKTVVKCDENDIYDPMKGVALCYMKKMLGNKSGAFNKALRKSGAYEEMKKE